MVNAIRLLPLLVLTMSCGTSYQWRELQDPSDFDLVWTRFVDIATVSGYAADPLETDRGLRKFASRWREQPAPFRMGRRTRIVAEFERREDEPGWTVRFAIPMQAIDSIEAGFEPREEDWADRGQDFEREEIMLGQLRLAYGQDLGIRPTYERR